MTQMCRLSPSYSNFIGEREKITDEQKLLGIAHGKILHVNSDFTMLLNDELHRFLKILKSKICIW